MRTSLLLLPLFGCASTLSGDDVHLTIDDAIGTVAHVEWHTALPAEGWVEYGPDDYAYRTPLQASATDQSVALLGVPAGVTWHYRIVTRVGDTVREGEDATFHTDPLPSDIPPITVDGPEADDWTAFSWWSINEGDSFAGVLDRDGQLVWSWSPEDGYVQNARLSRDRTAMLVLRNDTGYDADAEIIRVPLDGSAPEHYAAPNAHHDFYELEDGTIGYIAGREAQIDGRIVHGDQIVEIHDGVSTVVWDAFERLPMVENDGFRQEPADWTHANGLGYEPMADAWLLSLYWDRTVLRIDRDTGEIAWYLGGDRSLFSFTDGGFGPQHSPEWVDGEVLLFDNAADGTSSRLVQYTLDTEAETATVSWQWKAPEGEFTRLLGDVDRTEDGGAIAAMGENEELLWIDPAGNVTRTVTLDGDGMLGALEAAPNMWPADAAFP